MEFEFLLDEFSYEAAHTECLVYITLNEVVYVWFVGGQILLLVGGGRILLLVGGGQILLVGGGQVLLVGGQIWRTGSQILCLIWYG